MAFLDSADDHSWRGWKKIPDYGFFELLICPSLPCFARIIHNLTGEIYQFSIANSEHKPEIFKSETNGNAYIYVGENNDTPVWLSDVMKFEVGHFNEVEVVRMVNHEKTAFHFAALSALVQANRQGKSWTLHCGTVRADVVIKFASFFVGRSGGGVRCYIDPAALHSALKWSSSGGKASLWVQRSFLGGWAKKRDFINAHAHALVKGIETKPRPKKARLASDPACDPSWKCLQAASMSLPFFMFLLCRWALGLSTRQGALDCPNDRVSAREVLIAIVQSCWSEVSLSGGELMPMFLKDFQQPECGWPQGKNKVFLPVNAEKRVFFVEELLVHLRNLGGKGKELRAELGPHLQEDHSIDFIELMKALLQHSYAEKWAYQVVLWFSQPLDLHLSSLVWEEQQTPATATELIVGSLASEETSKYFQERQICKRLMKARDSSKGVHDGLNLIYDDGKTRGKNRRY